MIHLHQIIVASTGCSENDTVIQLIRDTLPKIRKSNERPDMQSVFKYKNTNSF